MKLFGDVRISKRLTLGPGTTLLLVVMNTVAEAMHLGRRIVTWAGPARRPDILEISFSGGDNVSCKN